MNSVNHFIDQQYIDWNLLETVIRETLPQIPSEKMMVKKFSEGYSNQTYLLSFGDWETVLRRPPFGEIPAKAHDIKREFTLLSKLYKHYPLAPKPYLYKEDPSIMDRHFYVMEKKQGIVINDTFPQEYGPTDLVGPAISKSIISSLIGLQKVDYKKANLIDIGKPEGFLERQVRNWIKRYRNAKTDELVGVEDLEKWLLKEMPTTLETTIVHNDFKLNNLVLDSEDPSVVKGVLDWELATIGDPMTDIGALITYWGEAGDPDMGISVVTNQPGFKSRREMAKLYSEMSGRDISNIHYYVAFGFYKLAVILQQLYDRWKKGAVNDQRFEKLTTPISNLFELANLSRTNKLL